MRARDDVAPVHPTFKHTLCNEPCTPLARRPSKGERTHSAREEPRFRIVRSSTPSLGPAGDPRSTFTSHEDGAERTSTGREKQQRQRRSCTPMRHERLSGDITTEPGSCASLLAGEGPAAQILKARSLSNVALSGSGSNLKGVFYTPAARAPADTQRSTLNTCLLFPNTHPLPPSTSLLSCRDKPY